MDVGTAQRITVIGSPGGGKSTLATAIAAATGLPLFHLDREYWQSGWVEPDKAAWRARNAVLVAGKCWVICRRKRPAIGRALSESGVTVVRLSSVMDRVRFTRDLAAGRAVTPSPDWRVRGW